MFPTYILSPHKVNMYWQDKLELFLSYISIDVHYYPVPSDITDDLSTTNQPLCADLPITPKKFTAPAISPPWYM